MRILCLHSNSIEYEAVKKAIKEPEALKGKKGGAKDCLVVFMSVEKRDEKNPSAVASQLVSEIKDVADKVKTKSIVLYPYVHLSSEPSKPATALHVLDLAEKGLKGFKVTRSPFGWYKSFNIDVKGHPLAELSREFGPEKEKQEVSTALKKEEKLKSAWYILDTNGKLHKLSNEKNKIKGFDFSKHKRLEMFASYEMAKKRSSEQEPAHVRLMKQLELADYEPGSDPGNLRYPPKGKMVKKLLEELVTRNVQEYGGLEIEAPIMFDIEHPSLKSYMHRFPARQYQIQTPNKTVFLRFAACFGQFLMAHDAIISYKNLPLKLYELTKYSFRVEQRGELTGLRRLRAFTMPDCHALVRDTEMAKSEMKKRFDRSMKIHKQTGFDMPNDMEFAIRVVKPVWEKQKDFIKSLVKDYGKPALLEMWEEQFFYYILKYEWNFVDDLCKASALNTDQIDVENGKSFDLKFMDEDGSYKHPLILHWSPSGAIERVMYALLEKANWDMKEGKIASLPLWLSPTQIRVIPVSDKHVSFAKKVADELSKGPIRVDVDDNDDTVGKKIRNASKEWIPYIAVVGDDEVKSKKLNVRIRTSGKNKNYAVDELSKEILKKTSGMPFQPLPLPRNLSERPIFIP
ncbi:threonine--tRNA ligase [Nanoarchaeota archaeon]